MPLSSSMSLPSARMQVGVVGLGVIGAVHAKVIAAIEAFELLFVVDPRSREVVPGRDDVATFASLDEALHVFGASVDLIVIATPTDTHLELSGQALEHTQALVLSEKPLARDPGALAAFESRHEARLHRLRIVNHFAFSPEVEWAAAMTAAEELGPPQWVFCNFNDPYEGKTDSERRTYVSSWVDSGANQLSMLARFAQPWRVVSHEVDAGGLRSVTQLRYAGGSAVLGTNWRTGDSSKQTMMRWDGGRELFLDHTAMTGFALRGRDVTHHLGHDGTTDRKAAHYIGMYRALLSGRQGDLLGLSLAGSVADVLAEASAKRKAVSQVSWLEASTPDDGT